MHLTAIFVTGEYDAQVFSNTMRNDDIGIHWHNIRNAAQVTVTADFPKQVNITHERERFQREHSSFAVRNNSEQVACLVRMKEKSTSCRAAWVTFQHKTAVPG